ncbi:unnamed protein product [Vitrella brassicaformis CCMP3155]|uniref:tubulin-glutamate carboxypeptidase n=3 Tax=Vitrella brassicaformis TaxID=1169539 RepID=A0A0G4ESJ8_VITBC|nr:unnamed protein product [Vitrella brassicaformis CCMP3155]|eukprot:CEM01605.1 unnamed protein product [Vitrella brassicaformis CCMP3155]
MSSRPPRPSDINTTASPPRASRQTASSKPRAAADVTIPGLPHARTSEGITTRRERDTQRATGRHKRGASEGPGAHAANLKAVRAPPPPPKGEGAKLRKVLGEWIFFSDFDSGNAAEVEEINGEYHVWVAPDCLGTPFPVNQEHKHHSKKDDAANGGGAPEGESDDDSTESEPTATEKDVKDKDGSGRAKKAYTPFHTWFYFGIEGGTKGTSIALVIRRLNQQGRLFQQGMKPVVRCVPHATKWKRLTTPCVGTNVNGEFRVSFRHTFEADGGCTYFAFTYPFSYAANQLYLDLLEHHFRSSPFSPAWHPSSQPPSLDPCPAVSGGHAALHKAHSCPDDPLLAAVDEEVIEEDIRVEDDSTHDERDRDRKRPPSSVWQKLTAVWQRRKSTEPLPLKCDEAAGEKLPAPSLPPIGSSANVAPRVVKRLCGAMQGSRARSFDHPQQPDKPIEADNTDSSPNAAAEKLVIEPAGELDADFKQRDSVRRLTLSEFEQLTGVSFQNGVTLSTCRDVYFARQLLCHSLEGRRVELLTITAAPQSQLPSFQRANTTTQIGVPAVENERSNKLVRDSSRDRLRPSGRNISNLPAHLLPTAVNANTSSSSESSEAKRPPRESPLCFDECAVAGVRLGEEPPSALRLPLAFPGRKVIFISARVHPGETPGQFVCLGLLHFLLSTDPRAQLLRHYFVFKCVPIINPDGVARGHYRANLRGQNLNRYYDTPHPHNHEAIAPIRRLLVHWATKGIPMDRKGGDGGGRLAFYMDLHGHATKRGTFVLANHLSGWDQIWNVAFSRLLGLNSPHFEPDACSFSMKNMKSKDNRDGLSKEGSGRVAVYRATGLYHSYTLECNYNAGRCTHPIPSAPGVEPQLPHTVIPVSQKTPVPYTDEVWAQIGQAICVSVLDFYGWNPCSRLPSSRYRSLIGLLDSFPPSFKIDSRNLARNRSRLLKATLPANTNNSSINSPLVPPPDVPPPFFPASGSPLPPSIPSDLPAWIKVSDQFLPDALSGKTSNWPYLNTNLTPHVRPPPVSVDKSRGRDRKKDDSEGDAEKSCDEAVTASELEPPAAVEAEAAKDEVTVPDDDIDDEPEMPQQPPSPTAMPPSARKMPVAINSPPPSPNKSQLPSPKRRPEKQALSLRGQAAVSRDRSVDAPSSRIPRPPSASRTRKAAATNTEKTAISSSPESAKLEERLSRSGWQRRPGSRGNDDKAREEKTVSSRRLPSFESQSTAASLERGPVLAKTTPPAPKASLLPKPQLPQTVTIPSFARLPNSRSISSGEDEQQPPVLPSLLKPPTLYPRRANSLVRPPLGPQMKRMMGEDCRSRSNRGGIEGILASSPRTIRRLLDATMKVEEAEEWATDSFASESSVHEDMDVPAAAATDEGGQSEAAKQPETQPAPMEDKKEKPVSLSKTVRRPPPPKAANPKAPIPPLPPPLTKSTPAPTAASTTAWRMRSSRLCTGRRKPPVPTAKKDSRVDGERLCLSLRYPNQDALALRRAVRGDTKGPEYATQRATLNPSRSTDTLVQPTGRLSLMKRGRSLANIDHHPQPMSQPQQQGLPAGVSEALEREENEMMIAAMASLRQQNGVMMAPYPFYATNIDGNFRNVRVKI